MTDKEFARQIRRDALDMSRIARISHIGSSLSIADVLAVLYNGVLNISPQTMGDPDRDRFVLSKGHACAALYAALAEKGFFPREELLLYGVDGSRLAAHASGAVPGVELSTGSLGQGVCVAAGFALAAKMDTRRHAVYALAGDGECEEGCVWEAALFAAARKLDNFTLIIDRNGLQGLGSTESILQLGDLALKFRAFGWDAYEVDGHDCAMLRYAFLAPTSRPKCVVARTVKGKGVSFMENDNLWHYRDPQGAAYEKAAEEIGGTPLCALHS
ncbi:MAG: transketolase [Desulfovibrionaceae bacterium]|nr:transketolase [Desulfovibrionaceae bacterium]